MKNLLKVVIDRRKWARHGAHKGYSALLNERGNMCCLGFVCRALGLKPKHIRNVNMPDDVKKLLPGLTKPYKQWGFVTTRFSDNAADINDAPDLADEQREKKLIPLARKAGFEFVFTH